MFINLRGLPFLCQLTILIIAFFTKNLTTFSATIDSSMEINYNYLNKVNTHSRPTGPVDLSVFMIRKDESMLTDILILIADEHSSRQKKMRDLIQSAGYHVMVVGTGQEVLRQAKDNPNIDLFLISTNLSDLTPKDVCTSLRETSNAPVILLTEAKQDGFLDAVYDFGADDVLFNPYSEEILLFKIKTSLRRYLVYRGKVIDLPGIRIDEERHIVTKNGQPVEMTDLELSILEFMLSQNGKIVSIQQIYEGVWGEKYFPPSSNTVMVHILNIRKKLEDNVSHPKLIRTVWGKGYKLSGIAYARDPSHSQTETISSSR